MAEKTRKVTPRRRRVPIAKAKVGPRMVAFGWCCGTAARKRRSNVGSFCIQWGVRFIGFGGVTVSRGKDGKVYLDTEHMGRQFCAKVFHAFGKKIIGRQVAVDGAGYVTDVRLGEITGDANEKMDDRHFWFEGTGAFVVTWVESYSTGAKERSCTVQWKNGKATADSKEPLLPFVLQQLALSSELLPDVGE